MNIPKQHINFLSILSVLFWGVHIGFACYYTNMLITENNNFTLGSLLLLFGLFSYLGAALFLQWFFYKEMLPLFKRPGAWWSILATVLLILLSALICFWFILISGIVLAMSFFI